jgi:hypothetical protein
MTLLTLLSSSEAPPPPPPPTKRRGVSARVRKALEEAAKHQPPALPVEPVAAAASVEVALPVVAVPDVGEVPLPPAPPVPLPPAALDGLDGLEVVPWSPEREAARQPYTPDAPALLGPNTWTTLDEDELVAVLAVLTPGALAPLP